MGTKGKELWQCQDCGNSLKTDGKYKPRDGNIYAKLWCKHCKKITQQLYCGDNIDDWYLYENVNVDQRY